jgi:hypothetical protein
VDGGRAAEGGQTGSQAAPMAAGPCAQVQPVPAVASRAYAMSARRAGPGHFGMRGDIVRTDVQGYGTGCWTTDPPTCYVYLAIPMVTSSLLADTLLTWRYLRTYTAVRGNNVLIIEPAASSAECIDHRAWLLA